MERYNRNPKYNLTDYGFKEYVKVLRVVHNGQWGNAGSRFSELDSLASVADRQEAHKIISPK